MIMEHSPWAPSGLVSAGSLESYTFHPQSIGLVERFHRCLKVSLRAQLSGTNWFHHLPLVLLGLWSVLREDSAPIPKLFLVLRWFCQESFWIVWSCPCWSILEKSSQSWRTTPQFFLIILSSNPETRPNSFQFNLLLTCSIHQQGFI